MTSLFCAVVFAYSTDMSHDFELLLEVYSHRVSEHQHVASTPKKLRKKLNSFSTSVGRRLSGLVCT